MGSYGIEVVRQARAKIWSDRQASAMGCGMRILFVALSYSVSVVLAIPFTFGWSWLLHHLTDDRNLPSPARNRWGPFLIGVLERAVVTTIVGWDLPGSAVYVIGWMALKHAGCWWDLKDGGKASREKFQVGLLGTLLSVLFAVAGGLLILNCATSGSESDM
jgi:hypothetical protein